MEGKKKSVAGELSLLDLELKRIHGNVLDLQKLVSLEWSILKIQFSLLDRRPAGVPG